MRQIGTPDLIQGKVLAALPWEGGCKTEAVARHASLDEDTVRRALEDLVRRGMVTIDDCSYWRKNHWIDAGVGLSALRYMRPHPLKRSGGMMRLLPNFVTNP